MTKKDYRLSALLKTIVETCRDENGFNSLMASGFLIGAAKVSIRKESLAWIDAEIKKERGEK